MTIVIELFQLFSNNIFEGESFPSAASPLCSISAAPSGTSSRLRSLTIYNSQIFTSSRYSDIQIFRYSHPQAGWDLKQFIIPWFSHPLNHLSVVGIVSLFLIHWFVFQKHILWILPILLLKPHWGIFLYNWVRATNNHMSLFVKQITSRGIFLCVPNSKCIVWHFSSYFTSFATVPLPILLFFKKCVVSVVIAFAWNIELEIAKIHSLKISTSFDQYYILLQKWSSWYSTLQINHRF